MIDYAGVALGFSIVALVLAVPLFVMLAHAREATPLIGFIILMLCVGGVVGAFGRWAMVDHWPELDAWIRIVVIATRVAVIGAMLYDIRWLWMHRVRKGGSDGVR